LPYGIDFDSAPGFWLMGHPANGSAAVRKFEGAMSAVTFLNPYTGTTQKLARFLVDQPGLQALHMLTSDVNRNASVVVFGQENNFNTIFSLIFRGASSCNRFPDPNAATCLNNGFIWIHGNYAPDVNNTWAALVGPGVLKKGVDRETFADHSDLRPTMMTLLCLKDNYTHEGRALLEDLSSSALSDSAHDVRGSLIGLGETFKQLNAPVGLFGRDAIQVSTTAIKGNASTYTSLESQLQTLVNQRDALSSSIEAQLDQVPGCGGSSDAAGPARAAADREREANNNRNTLERLNDRAQALIEQMQRLANVEE
jgi:hypothetical protein